MSHSRFINFFKCILLNKLTNFSVLGITRISTGFFHRGKGIGLNGLQFILTKGENSINGNRNPDRHSQKKACLKMIFLLSDIFKPNEKKISNEFNILGLQSRQAKSASPAYREIIVIFFKITILELLKKFPFTIPF